MEEKEFSEPCSHRQVSQQASVPFLWEEKPGTPKKDWKLKVVPANAVPPPVKLATSIPFKWEEKPGKPLSYFSQSSPDSPLPLVKIDFQAPSVPSQSPSPSKIHGKLGIMFQKRRQDDDYAAEQQQEGQEEEGMLELDLQAFGFVTDESFTSAPSLLANRLVSAVAISRAVPMAKPYEKGISTAAENNHSQYESPASPASETESYASSYATGRSSPVGGSFLECLFPLFSPDSGFLDKVGFPEKVLSPTPPELQAKEFDCGSNCNVMVRRTPTLGELLLMSRRISYRWNGVHLKKKSLYMEFLKKSMLGRCILGTSRNAIYKLHRRRQVKD